MILRRFMKHVTDQNWFAVGLDVLVVIVGIFLGLQVQAWYDGRNEQIAAEAFVNKLTDDISIAIAVTEEDEALYLKHVDNGKIAMKYLRGEIKFEDHSNEITSGFNGLTLIANASIGVGNIEILFAGDAPLLMADDALNNRISELVTDIKDRIIVIEHMVQQINVLLPTLYQFYTHGGYLGEEFSNQFDVDAMRQSRAYKYGLQTATNMQYSAYLYHKRIRENFQEILEILRNRK